MNVPNRQERIYNVCKLLVDHYAEDSIVSALPDIRDILDVVRGMAGLVSAESTDFEVTAEDIEKAFIEPDPEDLCGPADADGEKKYDHCSSLATLLDLITRDDMFKASYAEWEISLVSEGPWRDSMAKIKEAVTGEDLSDDVFVEAFSLLPKLIEHMRAGSTDDLVSKLLKSVDCRVEKARGA